MSQPIITLTTDFGTKDSYVAAMKGVILTICPNAKLVDITHDIPPQNVFAAAYTLEQAVPYFPRHAVHLAVVDPGVGTDRRHLVVDTEHGMMVLPDNGLVSLAAPRDSVHAVYEAVNSGYWLDKPSNTFHGRDIFAPIAAHLAKGVDPRDMGPLVKEIVRLEIPAPEVTKQSVLGQVIYIDSFGNALTNIRRENLEQAQGQAENWFCKIGDRIVEGPLTTYSKAPKGGGLLLWNSDDRLELAVNQGSAERKYGLKTGDRVTLLQEISEPLEKLMK